MDTFALSGVKTWEALATVQIVQRHGAELCADYFQIDWVMEAAIDGWLAKQHPIDFPTLNYGEALRLVDDSDMYYGDTLALASGYSAGLSAPQFPKITPSETGGIIVCPFHLQKAFSIPVTVWRAIIRHLRSYNLPVRVMGEVGDRLDACMFSEAENLSDCSIKTKLDYVANAHLVLGVPCTWLWASTAWKKKVMILYPGDMPQQRWFPVVDHGPGSSQRWLLYEPHKIQIPIMLSAIRQLLSKL